MAKLPAAPPPVAHRVIKRACGLSPRAQRRLFGPPPEIDGQVLASDIHALIRLAAMAGTTSFTGGLPVAEARIANKLGAEATMARPPIPMARVEGVEVPGPAGPLPSRLYVPLGMATDKPVPMLVYYHGGGWTIGDLDTHDGVCRFLASAAGVAVLSIGYRLAPEHPFPAGVEDAWAGFAWAAANAAAMGVDPERIAVGGDSAGGNLAAVVSLLSRSGGGAVPAMQLLLYPVTDSGDDLPSRKLFAEGFLLTRDDMDTFERHYLPEGVDAADPRISVLQAPDLRGLPPAYVATAGFDPLRDEGEAYALRMREAGVHVALRRHPGLIHSFANETAISRTSRAAMLETAGALRMGLAPGDAGR
ncbi:MAG TPA: alpha/beta hydrolase [Solirubrobacterales bacterium]|jgi:acetyl esterase|nr:alpha/beta hydrolase [Solirubrobacterales bacterium]